VDGLGQRARESLEWALATGGPFTSVADVVRRSGLPLAALRTLAEAGAFESLWRGRRSALWEVLARRVEAPLAPVPADPRPPLRELPRWDLVLADYATTGLCTSGHPMELLRPALRSRGVLSAQDLQKRRAGERVAVAGVVICRQRPGTAKGFCFITLEDETGMSNFIVHPRTYAELGRVIVRAPALLIHGRVQNEAGVVNVWTQSVEPLAPLVATAGLQSHDFR
jgi:error-prone DNA polymerase